MDSKETLSSKHLICDMIESCNSLTDIPSQNVCRIHAHARGYDWKFPPKKEQGKSGTGTGFVLERKDLDSGNGIFIITAHHVVAHAINIRVHFDRIDSERREAFIVGSNPELDVSILYVKTFPGSEKLTGLKLGNSDDVRALDKVVALGYALGKDHMQSTAGVISGRIAGPSRLQIDVAVNPGNSGGPLLNKQSNVVGIVTSGMSNAQNINYAAPMKESMVVIERIIYLFVHDMCLSKVTKRKTVIDYLPRMNACFSRANSTLLKSINHSCNHGMYCTFSNSPILREGDILCEMQVGDDVYNIDLQMSVKFPFWEDRLPMECILDRLQPGQPITYKLWRDLEPQTAIVKLGSNQKLFRERYSELESVPYVCRGGVMIMPLCHNHLQIFRHHNLYTLVNSPGADFLSFPVITHIMGESPFNESETISAGDVIVAINNHDIRTVDDVQTAFEKEMQSQNTITIRCRDGCLATATVENIQRTEEIIIKEYSPEYIGLYSS